MNDNRRTYHGFVSANCLRTSRQKGTPSVTVQVHVDKDLSTGSAVDAVVTGELWLTDNTIDKTLETLSHVFGWEGASLRELNSPVLTGAEVDVVTHDEEYEGRTFTKVDFFNRPGETGYGLKKAQDSEAEFVASKYDSALRRFRSGAASPQASRPDRAKAPAQSAPAQVSTQAQARPAASADDDLPF